PERGRRAGRAGAGGRGGRGGVAPTGPRHGGAAPQLALPGRRTGPRGPRRRRGRLRRGQDAGPRGPLAAGRGGGPGQAGPTATRRDVVPRVPRAGGPALPLRRGRGPRPPGRVPHPAPARRLLTRGGWGAPVRGGPRRPRSPRRPRARRASAGAPSRAV